MLRATIVCVLLAACADSSPAPKSDAQAQDTDWPSSDTGEQAEDTGGQAEDTSGYAEDTASPPEDSGGSPEDTGEPPALLPAPSINGEHSAGHTQPTWTWTWPHEATELQWRIDDGSWWEGDPTEDRVTSPTPLTEGSHTVSIRAADADGLWSSPGTFVTEINLHSRPGYWSGVAHDLTSSPLGHELGIVAHNCYEDSASSPGVNLIETLNLLTEARADGADLLELDVRYADGDWVVEHDDWGGTDAARLADVLADGALKAWTQPLFIEIKERDPTLEESASLLNLLISEGYAVNGRPVFFRAFQDERVDNLVFLRELLDSGDYVFNSHYFRLHLLLDDDTAGSTSGFQALIDAADSSGFDGVEFSWTTPDLFNLIEYAEALELGTAMWTVPELMGEAWCASMREDIDALVVDYDIDECRLVAEEDTHLIYMNTADIGSSMDVEWSGSGGEPMLTELGALDLPTTASRSSGAGLLGTALLFEADLQTSLPLYDADNDVGEGFLLAATIEFDDLDLSSGETVAILSKADSGAFALELHGEFWSTKLRFGVHIGDEYHYSDVSVSGLDTAQSHFIMASYDGAGRVRLWLNNSDSGVDETAVLAGGVTQNDVPVRLGADPEGSTDTRYHFSGRIQMAMLQKWRDH